MTFKEVAKAIEFYQRAFGARETFRFQAGGQIPHAEIAIGDSILMLVDEWPEGGRFSAETLGNSPVWVSIRRIKLGERRLAARPPVNPRIEQ